jgi:hypothetical protein
MAGPWEHTTQWRDRFERLQEPTIDPAGDPLLAFINARIIELETAPRFDLTDELHDTPGGAIAQRYAEHLRKDCVAFRRIVVQYVEAGRIDEGDVEYEAGRQRQAELAVMAIANRWADHPDFRDEWRIQ